MLPNDIKKQRVEALSSGKKKVERNGQRVKKFELVRAHGGGLKAWVEGGGVVRERVRGSEMKKGKESEVRGARGLIECGCACSRVAGGRQPTNRGKIMGRSSFVHVGGSMLSAFTFREFRVINRRARR